MCAVILSSFVILHINGPESTIVLPDTRSIQPRGAQIKPISNMYYKGLVQNTFYAEYIATV